MRRGALTLGLALVTLLAATTVALAFWSTSGSGTSAASVGTLNAAAIGVPGTSTGSTVVTWTQQATLPASPAQDAGIVYRVERKSGSGTFAPVASGGCSGSLPHGTASCTDTVAASGAYTYRVIADFAGGSWTAASNEAGPVTTTVGLADTTPPQVASIVRVGSERTNAASVSWTVTYTEPVTGVDAGDFALVKSGLGGTPAIDPTVTGSGSTYTVTATTGTGDGSLGLNAVDDDSVKDGGLNPLGGPGAGNGNFTGQVFQLDRTVPTVSSIARAASSPTNASSVSWTVTFSESVTGVDAGDFALASSGLTGTPAISSVTGSGAAYTVTASTGTGSGTLGLNLVDNDTVVDAATNRLGGPGAGNGSLTGEVYTLDRTAPTAQSIARVSATPTNSTTPSWTVTFSEAVTNVTASEFALVGTASSGATITSVVAVSGGGGATYTVTAGVTATSGTLGLNLVDDDDISDTAGNRLGGPGNGNGSFTGQAYTIDRTSPTVTALASADSDGLLEAGDRLTITFSEPIAAAPAGAIAVTESRASSTANVLLTITGVTTNSNTGSVNYLSAQSGTRTATFSGGTAALTSANVITVTVGSAASGNGTPSASSGALQFAPLSSLQDAAGNGATGTFTTGASFKLF